jgi:hypothetical protein
MCSTYKPPQTYKSKGSKIHLYYKPVPVRDSKISYIGKREEDIEGYRLQFKISEHSFEKYTTSILPVIDSAYLAGTHFNIYCEFKATNIVSTVNEIYFINEH